MGSNKGYYLLLAIITVICAVFHSNQAVAMWLIFGLAAYSAIANDSIQTIGTFISSNAHRKWYYMWLFMGLIFVATVTYSYVKYDGDVSYQRLLTKGIHEAPSEFTFLQAFAPVVLLILTRLRMPVSTSILLLSAFSTKAGPISKILTKSFFGYFLAFVVAIVIWALVSRAMQKALKKPAASFWVPLQWVTSGLLWSVWIMQDAANIAVVLPRSLDIGQFLVFTMVIFAGLGGLFYLKGDRIQEIVNEKSGIQDVRMATLIDFVYSVLLYYLKFVSTIPISTTWVFIGLLGGRELAMNFMKTDTQDRKIGVVRSLKMIRKDATRAAVGLIVSLILAILINDKLKDEFLKWIRSFTELF